MSLRGRSVGVALVLAAELGAALVLGLGSASAEPKPSPFRTAQITAPSSPEPPLAGAPAPPQPPPAPPPAAILPPLPGTPCPVDPPTPTVAIRVRAPASAAPGQDLEYRICLENTSRAPAHHVTVRNPLPANAKFVRATPKPDQVEPELLWRLGTLDGCACREIVLVLSPTGGGDVDDCARVQFEHGQCVTTRVSRPQLVLRKAGPTEAAVGEALTFRITVTNAGAVEAANVVLVEKFQQGWQYGQEPFDKDKVIEKSWQLGAIGPGQSQTVEYQATPRVAGRLCASAEATAAGGLISAPARHCVEVGSRLLTLMIEGPPTAYARRPVNYFLTVRNEGTVPATDVVVTDPLPTGLEFVDANQGGRYADGRVSWDLRTLAPGQSRILRLRVRSDAEREVRQMPVATYGRGLKASTEITTTFRGAAGFDFDVEANEYAVEVDAPVRYTVTVFNRGSGAQTNVRVVVELPPEMELKEARGPGGVKSRTDKGVVTFDPLPTLAADKDAEYVVEAVARKVGDARARVGMAAGPAERFTYKAVPVQVGEKQPP
jgi:uncharacterized repeat protein (TIGR01451 family)